MQTGAAANLRKPEREQLAGMAVLTFTTEATRDPGHLADVAMATSLIGQKKGRLTEVIGGNPDDPITSADLVKGPAPGQGGLLPLTAKGAQASSFELQTADAAADLDRLDDPNAVPGSNQPRPVRNQGTTAEQRGASNIAHTRMLLAERWVEVRMQADPEAFRDREAAKAAIERHLREFYKLALKAPAPAGGGS